MIYRAQCVLKVAGLSAGLLAIAAHSFVQYNFYVIPILLLSGLLLARIQELRRAVPPRAWRWRPDKHLSAAGYRLIVLVLALLPLSYFSSIGISAYQLSRGDTLAAQHLFDEADQAFMTAQRFWPDSDAPLIARAGLYLVVLARGGRDVEQQKLCFSVARRYWSKLNGLTRYVRISLRFGLNSTGRRHCSPVRVGIQRQWKIIVMP